MGRYRYDLLSAFHEYGINEHPQRQMRNLGFELIYSEPIAPADCWIFRTTNEIDDLPGYIYEISVDRMTPAEEKYFNNACRDRGAMMGEESVE